MIGTSFPVIMPDPSGKPVAGEIYTVDDATLARLDRLEAEGRSYDRVMIDATLPLANGERLTTQGFIYVGREDPICRRHAGAARPVGGRGALVRPRDDRRHVAPGERRALDHPGVHLRWPRGSDLPTPRWRGSTGWRPRGARTTA